MELSIVKDYLRIDNEYDDELLNRFSLVAEAYVRGAVNDYDAHITDDSFKKISEMVQLAYISELYENRMLSSSKEPSFMIRSMLLQLQTMPVVSE